MNGNSLLGPLFEGRATAKGGANNQLRLPRANLVASIPNRYPFADRIGKHDGPAQLRQFAEVTSGTVTLHHASIVGAETITSHGGTATVSAVAGGITIGVGTAWEIRDSAGHLWSHCAALSSTSVVMWDVSGLGDHLIATGLAESSATALCSVGRDFVTGTDWLDRGYGTSFRHDVTSDITSIPPDNRLSVETVIGSVPCYMQPAGIANYTLGAYHLTCAGSVDDRVLSIAGGDSVVDAGSGIWKCVVQYPDGELEFNIVDIASGATCTLVNPLKKAGPVNVWAAWDGGPNTLHYSLIGVRCFAEMIYRRDRRSCQRGLSAFSISHADTYAIDPWSKLSPMVWQPTGGLANNAIIQGATSNLNPSTSIDKKVHSAHNLCSEMTTTAQWQGAVLSIPTSVLPFSGLLSFSTGCVTDDNTFKISTTVTVDGTDVYNVESGNYVKKHDIFVNGSSAITISVIRLSSGTTSIKVRIGAVHLFLDVGPESALINKNSKVMLCGSSRMDGDHPTGIGFGARLQELMSADGGSGVVVNVAKQGMTTNWGKKWLPYYLDMHHPDQCIINFYLNDYNVLQGTTFVGPDGGTYTLSVANNAEYANNIKDLVAICSDYGCEAIVVLPEPPASPSQYVPIMEMARVVDAPVLRREWLIKATTSELGNVNFVGNVRNKISGRLIKNVNTSADLVASSSFRSAPWITAPTSCIIPPAVLPGEDVLRNPLQYCGPPRNNITRLTGESTTIDPAGTYTMADTNAWRVVTGWTAGTANDFFAADGLPISFTGQQLIDSGIGPQFYCGSKGIAGYLVDQDAPTNAKIIKILKVPTYIDTLYWSDHAEMDWSASNE